MAPAQPHSRRVRTASAGAKSSAFILSESAAENRSAPSRKRRHAGGAGRASGRGTRGRLVATPTGVRRTGGTSRAPPPQSPGRVPSRRAGPARHRRRRRRSASTRRRASAAAGSSRGRHRSACAAQGRATRSRPGKPVGPCWRGSPCSCARRRRLPAPPACRPSNQSPCTAPPARSAARRPTPPATAGTPWRVAQAATFGWWLPGKRSAFVVALEPEYGIVWCVNGADMLTDAWPTFFCSLDLPKLRRFCL
eukprot:scaffold5393_cov129-Isochrysis_galbana.AAC.5